MVKSACCSLRRHGSTQLSLFGSNALFWPLQVLHANPTTDMGLLLCNTANGKDVNKCRSVYKLEDAKVKSSVISVGLTKFL